MTDKEREIIENCEISDILDIKGKEDILDEIPVHEVLRHYDTDDILDGISVYDIALHYDLDDILDEYRSDSDIAEYLDNKGYDFSSYIDDEENETDNYSETDLLVTLCRRLHPYGILTKEDMREIVNDYINDMINCSY